MRYNQLHPFLGAISALDPRSIPDGAASDHLNAREEDGSIKFRYGFRNLAAAQASFSAVHGMSYLQGYNSTTETEEYVTAENRSGNTRFYSRNVTTGAPTEITNGGSSVNVNGSEWAFATFDGDAYFINPLNTSAPVYRHEIGTINSLSAIAIPDPPSAAPTYVVTYGGGSTPYSQLSWAGCDPTAAGEVACTGAATNTGSALNADNTLSIRHTDNKIASTIEIDMFDMTAGVQDWTYNDLFSFSVACRTSSFEIDGAGLQVQLINNDGSPKTLIPDLLVIKQISGISGASGKAWAIFFGWSDKTVRADFDNVRRFKLLYTVRKSSSTVSNNDLLISKPYIGGVDMSLPVTRDRDPRGWTVAYSYYFSTLDYESGISPTLFIPDSVLKGTAAFAGLPTLGTHFEIVSIASSDANVDNHRYYVQNRDTEAFHRLGTQSDADLSFDVRLTYAQSLRLTKYQATPFRFGGPVNAFPYKGHMVWLYQGGSANVKYSRNGDPLRQASDEDPDDDLAAGETFTLADNFGDEPLGGLQAGDAVMIAGKYGVYSQIGDRAVEMTPPRKVAGSFGVAGKYAFCRWKDDQGLAGIAYLSRDGQVFFSVPGAFTGKEIGDTINLTNMVRDGELSPKDFLLDEQSAFGYTDLSAAQVFADEQQDALWVVLGKRAMVLRRASLFNGARYWEHYEYNTGGATVSFKYVNGSGKRLLRCIRSDGKFDELEFNSSTRAYISGSNSDGGAAAPAGYWESKTFVGPNRRINFVAVERDDYTDTPTVTVYSSRTTAGNAVALTSGEKGARFLPSDQGEWYKVRVTLGESQDPIRRIKIEEFAAGRRRGA